MQACMCIVMYDDAYMDEQCACMLWASKRWCTVYHTLRDTLRDTPFPSFHSSLLSFLPLSLPTCAFVVVLSLLLRIAQNRIGLGDLLKHGLRLLLIVRVLVLQYVPCVCVYVCMHVYTWCCTRRHGGHAGQDGKGKRMHLPLYLTGCHFKASFR